MAQLILKANGEVVPLRNHRPLQVAEIYYPVDIKKREVITNLVKRRGVDPVTPVESDAKPEDYHHEYVDEEDEPSTIKDIEYSVNSTRRV